MDILKLTYLVMENCGYLKKLLGIPFHHTIGMLRTLIIQVKFEYMTL